jgi:hypothetical protein
MQPPPSTSASTTPAPWTLLHKAYLVAFILAANASVTSTVFYWPAIHKPGAQVRWDAPIEHGASALLLLLDLALSRTPVVSYHFQVRGALGPCVQPGAGTCSMLVMPLVAYDGRNNSAREPYQAARAGLPRRAGLHGPTGPCLPPFTGPGCQCPPHSHPPPHTHHPHAPHPCRSPCCS